MTERRLEPRFSRFLPLAVVLAGGAVALSVASRRPEPLLVALGPLAALAWTATSGQGASVRLRTELSAGRVREGGRVELAVSLEATGLAGPVAARLDLGVPAGVRVAGGTVRVFRLADGRPARLTFTVTGERRGVHRLGLLRLRVHEPGTLRGAEVIFPPETTLEVLPETDRPLRLPLRARVTGILPGLHPSRRVGAGVEFAGLREFAPGDALSDLDWRASARWRKWIVRQRLAARNAEIVIMLDALSSVILGGADTFDPCVRRAAALAGTFLGQGNRVGLVVYGGVLTWVRPGLGRAQRWRLVRMLRDAQVTPTYAHKDPSVVPRRVLPPHATVVAVTALADPRFADVLGSLRARGRPVHVVYLPPAETLPPRDASERLALRLWALEHRLLLDRLRQGGAGVTYAPVTARPDPGASEKGGRAGRPERRGGLGRRAGPHPRAAGLPLGTGLALLPAVACLGPGFWLAVGSGLGGGAGFVVGLAAAIVGYGLWGWVAAAEALGVRASLHGGRALLGRAATSAAATTLAATAVVALGLALTGAAESWLALVLGIAGVGAGFGLLAAVLSAGS